MGEAPGWLTAQAFAHRGLHGEGVPENSLAAFAAAIERGLGIECDVRVSADGRAMVFHDAETERLTGHVGTAATMSVGALTALTLGESGENVPTLRDMLSLVADRTPLLLELKSDGPQSVQKLCRAVRRDIEGYRGPLAVMSFDPRIPAWFARRVPRLPRGLVVTEEGAKTTTGAVKRYLSVWRAKPHFLAYDIRDLPSEFAAEQARGGRALLTWTVREAAHVETALASGAMPILEGDGVAAWEQRP